MVCISYAGEEAFDVILYIGRTLTKLNYRILIVDLSDSKALLNSINHGMDIDSSKDIVNYRDINYTRKVPTSEELAAFNSGIVLVAYGRNFKRDVILPCKELNIVINTFPHVIDEINTLIKGATIGAERVHILIRDIVSIDDTDRVKEAVKFQYEDEKDNYLYMDVSDYECAVNCQVNQVINFTNITSRMEKYITYHIGGILPNISHGQIKKALNAARKGR
jgi:hypothetical protein